MPMSSTNPSAEDGSALIEFLGLGTLLLVPALWFLLAVSQIQGAAYAAVGAADQAAKMYVASEGGPHQATARSEAAVHAALADFSLDPDQARISHHCTAACSEPGSTVIFTVEVRVPVPLIPEFAGFEHRLATVSSTAAHIQSR